MAAHVHHTVPTPLGDVLLACEVAGFEPCTASSRPLTRGAELHWVAAHGVDVGLVVVDGVELAIGTDDDHELAGRVASLDRSPLPAQWAGAVRHDDSGLVAPDLGASAGRDGLTVRLPPVPAGERADVHVAIACGPDRGDSAPWFAVLTSPWRILAHAVGRDSSHHRSTRRA